MAWFTGIAGDIEVVRNGEQYEIQSKEKEIVFPVFALCMDRATAEHVCFQLGYLLYPEQPSDSCPRCAAEPASMHKL